MDLSDLPSGKVACIYLKGFKRNIIHTRQMVDIKGDNSGATIMQATLKPESKSDYHTLAGGASMYVIYT